MALPQNIWKYFDSDEISNMVIRGDSFELKARRNIVSQQSDLLRAALNDEFGEPRTNILEFHHDDPGAIKGLVAHCYDLYFDGENSFHKQDFTSFADGPCMIRARSFTLGVTVTQVRTLFARHARPQRFIAMPSDQSAATLIMFANQGHAHAAVELFKCIWIDGFVIFADHFGTDSPSTAVDFIKYKVRLYVVAKKYAVETLVEQIQGGFGHILHRFACNKHRDESLDFTRLDEIARFIYVDCATTAVDLRPYVVEQFMSHYNEAMEDERALQLFSEVPLLATDVMVRHYHESLIA